VEAIVLREFEGFESSPTHSCDNSKIGKHLECFD